MTTVAVFVDKSGKRGMAADSQVTAEFKYTFDGSKILNAGELYLGICGLVPARGLKLSAHLATYEGVLALADEYMEQMGAAGHGGVDDQGVHSLPVTCLVIGANIGPYVIGSAGEVFGVSEGYAAIGSGAGLALGVLAAERISTDAGQPESPLEMTLVLALQAAIKHDPGSGGPIHFVVCEPVEKTARPKRVRKKPTTQEKGA